MTTEPILAYISETDRIHCAFCWEARQEDNHTDMNPNDWLAGTRDWGGSDECDSCGTKTGDNSDIPDLP